MQRPAADSPAASTSTVQQGRSHSQEAGGLTHYGLLGGEIMKVVKWVDPE